MCRISFFPFCIAGALFLLFQGSPIYAEVTCGMTISEEVTLLKDLTCETPTALIVEGPGGQLNLGGHTVRCDRAESTKGILLVGEGGTVENGTVTNCQVGVSAGDHGHHQVRAIIARNHSSAGFTTGGIGTSPGSQGNRFISNHAEQTANGFMVNGNRNFLFDNSSVDSERGFVVSQKGNQFTLNVSQRNDIGFAIQWGAEENHFIKNVSKNNTFAGFEIGGNRNRLVKNRATGNGRSMIDVGFRIIDAKENFLAWNVSDKNTGIGFEIVGLFSQSERNVLRGNVAQDNDHEGIAIQLLAEHNRLLENITTENGTVDLHDANPDCDDNQWIENTFDTADPQECIQ